MDDWDFGGDDDGGWGLFSDVGVDDNTYDLSDAYNDSSDDSWLNGFDYGSGPSGGGDDEINSSVNSYLDSDFTNDGGGSSAGGPWNALLGAGLNLASGYMQGAATEKLTKEQEALKEKLYAFQKAEDEKYYQAHGKQLADAYQGYKKYYQAPGSQPNPTAQFGLVSPGGPSGYFH
jgi:hypothetical protein